MALIDTQEHPAECPYCGGEQHIGMDVPLGRTVTARFACVDCDREFDVTVSITYTLDVEKVLSQ